MKMLITSLDLLNITFYQASSVLPPCSLLYRGKGQVKHCRATLSVVSFHSFLSAVPSLHHSSSPDLLISLLMQSSHLSYGLPLFLSPWSNLLLPRLPSFHILPLKLGRGSMLTMPLS